jgi:hypothetical protein
MNHEEASFTIVPDLSRHSRTCKICNHPRRAEIEDDFVRWKNPAKIAREYGLRDRSSIYRHAHATKLFLKRGRNIRAALETIIEQADSVPVNASAVTQAIALYARMNAQGELVEPSSQITFHDLFEQMSAEELEAYAKDGTVPPWMRKLLPATPSND